MGLKKIKNKRIMQKDRNEGNTKEIMQEIDWNKGEKGRQENGTKHKTRRGKR
jgi:hypothetical protein